MFALLQASLIYFVHSLLFGRKVIKFQPPPENCALNISSQICHLQTFRLACVKSQHHVALLSLFPHINIRRTKTENGRMGAWTIWLLWRCHHLFVHLPSPMLVPGEESGSNWGWRVRPMWNCHLRPDSQHMVCRSDKRKNPGAEGNWRLSCQRLSPAVFLLSLRDGSRKPRTFHCKSSATIHGKTMISFL